MISGITKVIVSVISASAFGKANYSYLGLDYSGCHKNLVQ